MLIGNNFVFLHVSKTGGTWMRQALTNRGIQTHCPYPDEYGYHIPLGYLPEKHEHLPVFALVRNPWDWYVSDYFFSRSIMGKKLSGRRGMDRWDTLLLYRSFDARLRGGISFSDLFNALTEHPRIQPTVLRYEDGLDKAFKQITDKDAPPLERVNRSERQDFRSYYNEEQQAVVKNRDRELIERFNYTF